MPARTGPLPAATGRSLGASCRPPVRLGPTALALTVAAAGALLASLGLTSAVLRSSSGSGPAPLATVARALVAPRAQQSLRVGFDSSGATVTAGTLRLTLALRAIGGGRSLERVPRVSPSTDASGAAYARPGLTEWYRHRPGGLEQGFTVARAPARSARGPLTIEVSLSGNSSARPSSDGRSLSFTRAGAPTLLYGALHAVDASGRPLHSWLSLRGRVAELHVDARGARYPLRIDPLVSQGGKLTTGQPNVPAYFGASAALSADDHTALVGAPRGNGAVWVFQHSGATWQRGQQLEGPKEKEVSEIGFPCATEPGGEEGEEDSGCGFGASVAISADGSTALVGSPREKRPCATEPTCPFQGAAWVFTRVGESWILQAVLLGGGEEGAGGRFGRAVALSADGNTAMIGAPADNASTGAVWVFTRSGSTWTQQGTKLTASNEAGAGRFGYALALSSDGSTALIGAPSDASYTGAAWSFSRSGSSWVQGEKLAGQGELGAAHFGASVALSSSAEAALIGGFRDNGERGAAWSFTRAGATWTLSEKLTGRGEKEGGWFGFSVALSGAGNLALVGGPKEANRVGVTWVFTRAGIGAGWGTVSQKLTAGVEAPDKPRFGHSVAVSGDGLTAFVGGPRDEDVAGAAWAFGHEVEVEAPPKKEVEETEREEEKPPEVTGVEPAAGPTAGGTTVTLRGHYLLKAAQVQFGSAKFRVAVAPGTASEQAVTVASPAHPEGTVDALVKLSNGKLSETRPEDHFTFFTPEAHGESPPPPGGSSGGGEVLSFGPGAGPPASCRASLLSRSVTVSSKGRAPLKLLLAGVGACRGKLTLSVKLTRPHARPKVRTIGTAGFAAATGKVVAVVVTLSKFGRGLLHASHGHLAASLVILRLSPGPAQAHTASVRLALKSSHPSATHH